MDLMGTYLKGMQMYVIVKRPVREINHCHRYFKALHPISSASFVGWPNATSLLLICSL